MKLRVLLVVLLTFTLLLVTPVAATVVNFDNLPTTQTWGSQTNAWADIPGNYMGLSWVGWEVMNQSAYQALYSDPTPLPSASNFAYPGLDTGGVLTVTGNPFNFLGVSFAYWPNTTSVKANDVTIRGYLGANLVAQATTFQLTTTWRGYGGFAGPVDRLEFSTNPGSGYFRMDNFSYESASAVPEPGTFWSLISGGGLLGLGLLKRKVAA